MSWPEEESLVYIGGQQWILEPGAAVHARPGSTKPSEIAGHHFVHRMDENMSVSPQSTQGTICNIKK